MAILPKQTNIVSNTIPSEYQEVEYIAGSGTQYIDTGVNLSSSDTVNCKFEVTSNPTSSGEAIYGTMEQINATNTFFILLMRNPIQARVGTSSNQVTSTNYALNTIYDTSLTNGKYIENETAYTFAPHNGFTFTTSCYVFSRNQSSMTPISAKVYSFEIVGKFKGIPCYRKSDNVIGMYDTVSKTFFENAGSGSFTKGNDVSDIKRYKVAFLNQTNNVLKLYRTEWGTESKNPTDSVTFDYNKMYYMAGSGYIRPDPGTLNETVTRTSVKYTQSTSTWWGIGFPMEVKPNTKYTISGSRSEGTVTKFVYTLYDNDGVFEDYAQVSSNIAELNPHTTITTGANTKSLVILVCGITSGATIEMWDIQVEEGQTQTTFKPYLYEENRRKVNLLSN